MPITRIDFGETFAAANSIDSAVGSSDRMIRIVSTSNRKWYAPDRPPEQGQQTQASLFEGHRIHGQASVQHHLAQVCVLGDAARLLDRINHIG